MPIRHIQVHHAHRITDSAFTSTGLLAQRQAFRWGSKAMGHGTSRLKPVRAGMQKTQSVSQKPYQSDACTRYFLHVLRTCVPGLWDIRRCHVHKADARSALFDIQFNEIHSMELTCWLEGRLRRRQGGCCMEELKQEEYRLRLAGGSAVLGEFLQQVSLVRKGGHAGICCRFTDFSQESKSRRSFGKQLLNRCR